jgi:hypothetical protein
MKVIIINLIINNTRHELLIDNFSFEYGIGPAKVGEKNLVLQYSLKIFGENCMKTFRQYVSNISTIFNDPEQLDQIEIQIVDKTNNNSECLIFNKNDFSNFNMMYVIDANPKGAISFEPILLKE